MNFSHFRCFLFFPVNRQVPGLAGESVRNIPQGPALSALFCSLCPMSCSRNPWGL